MQGRGSPSVLSASVSRSARVIDDVGSTGADLLTRIGMKAAPSWSRRPLREPSSARRRATRPDGSKRPPLSGVTITPPI
jgi:hypothetical protein